MSSGQYWGTTKISINLVAYPYLVVKHLYEPLVGTWILRTQNLCMS